MQVLLKNNVPNLGKPGDIVNVKSGYARNYLVPRGMAVAVKEGELKSVEFERKRLQKIAEKERMEMAALADRLRDASITITAKANEEGVLFGSVTPEMIAERLTAEFAPVDVSAIKLAEHIKAVGVFDVPVHLSAEFEVTAKVNVVAEGAESAQ